MADGVEALRSAGTRIESLQVIGGGARSAFWGRILASALGTRLVYPDGGDVGPALGAARLAQLATDDGDPAEVCVPLPVLRVVEPDVNLTSQMAPRSEQFRAAYPRITPQPEGRQS
jgi:xylulokinase